MNWPSLIKIFDQNKCKILIFCDKFWELSHLTRDLSQADQKNNFYYKLSNWHNDIYFTQNANVYHFAHLLSLLHFLSSKVEIIHMLKGTTCEIQHRNENIRNFRNWLSSLKIVGLNFFDNWLVNSLETDGEFCSNFVHFIFFSCLISRQTWLIFRLVGA